MKSLEILPFDTVDGGGLVAASPSHHIALFDILNTLPKDVYYAIDTPTSTDGDSPSLVLSAKEKFPDMDPASFIGAFKRCTVSKVFNKHSHYHVSGKKFRDTKWFMICSIASMEPSKSPDDQITAFQRHDESFWPHDCTTPSHSSPYAFKQAPTPSFVQSLGAKRERGNQYVTVESARKKAKVASATKESSLAS